MNPVERLMLKSAWVASNSMQHGLSESSPSLLNGGLAFGIWSICCFNCGRDRRFAASCCGVANMTRVEGYPWFAKSLLMGRRDRNAYERGP